MATRSFECWIAKLESTPNTLPGVTDPELVAMPTSQSRRRQWQRVAHKIVIVEDEGLIAADLEARLKNAGYSVPGTADTSERALEVIQKTSPDLVLMDIRLKGDVDGIETASRVREQLDIPVVFLTAYEDRGTLERAGQTQAFGYIKKPIASASLRGSIEMALSKHRYERDLRAQRDWMAASFRSVPHAVLVTDGQGRLTYLNSPAEKLTGWNSIRRWDGPAKKFSSFCDRETGSQPAGLRAGGHAAGRDRPLPGGISLRRDDGRPMPSRAAWLRAGATGGWRAR